MSESSAVQPSEQDALDLFPSELGGRVLLALSEFDHTTAWLPMRKISEAMPEVVKRRIHRQVGRFGIGTVETNFDGVILPCYPPLTTEIVADEFSFRDFYRDLPGRVTIRQAADAIGRSWSWTNNRLDELGIGHEALEQGVGYPSRMFGKIAIKQLREDALKLPYDSHWYNLNYICDATGEDREWVIRIMEELGVEPQIRRSSLTGKSLVSYPSEAISHLTSVRGALSPAPPGFATRSSIAQQIPGRNYKWVNLRLDNHREEATVYLDSNGVRRLHYPESVTKKLKLEAGKLAALGEVDTGDFLLFSDIAKLSGKSRGWLRKHLPRIEVDTIQGLDGKNRPKTFYHPGVLDKISEINPAEAIELQDVTDFLTLTGLAKATGKSRDWVKARLPKVEADVRTGKDARGNITTFYGPDTPSKLLAL